MVDHVRIVLETNSLHILASWRVYEGILPYVGAVVQERGVDGAALLHDLMLLHFGLLLRNVFVSIDLLTSLRSRPV